MEKANDWLEKNPDMEPTTCETLLLYGPEADSISQSESMMQTIRVTEGGKTYCMRGLRSVLYYRSITFLHVTPYWYLTGKKALISDEK